MPFSILHLYRILMLMMKINIFNNFYFMWKFKAKGYSILITRERTWQSDAWTVPKLNNSYLPSSIIILPDRNGGEIKHRIDKWELFRFRHVATL